MKKKRVKEIKKRCIACYEQKLIRQTCLITQPRHATCRELCGYFFVLIGFEGS